MKLVGMMLARNEEHEIGFSARVALMYCDALVILVHASTDKTAEMSASLAIDKDPRVTVVGKDDSGSWDEMQHRQAMLEIARAMGGTHMVIVDADEILTGNLLGTIRQQIRSLKSTAMQLLPGYNLRGSLDRYHRNGVWGDRKFSFAFMDRPELGWHGDSFHHREPWIEGRNPDDAFTERTVWRGGRAAGLEDGGIMHLWGANERRLKAKHAWYKMTERLRWPRKSVSEIDTMYSWAFTGMGGQDTPENWRYSTVPDSWWAPYRELMAEHLNIEAEPWQEAACRQMLADHGAQTFEGLDLFGVV